MADLQKALTEAKRFKTQYGALMEIAEVLEGIGDVERAAKAAEARRDAATREAGEIKAAADSDRAKAKDKLDEAARKVAAAATGAEETLQAARDEARQVVALAKGQAKTINDLAAVTEKEGKDSIKAYELRADGLKVEIADLESQRDKVKSEIEGLLAKLNG